MFSSNASEESESGRIQAEQSRPRLAQCRCRRRRRARRRRACQRIPRLSHLHTHTHTRTHTHDARTRTHSHTHTHTHTHGNTLQTTHVHEPACTRSHARTLKHTQCHSLWMRRTLLAFGSESASEDRAREELQRAADPLLQPLASHRIVCAWWPDEGSALEMAYSGGRSIACEGARLIEPVDLPNLDRGCATAVSCRSASCTSRTACPFPVCTSVAHLEPRYM